MQNVKIIQTEDGSHSLYLPELKETYHSFHGAVQESLYVYITQGFHIIAQGQKIKELKILEIGFGTGLNILLSIAEAQKIKIKTSIITLEPFPLSSEITSSLNYHEILFSRYPSLDLSSSYTFLHSAPWNQVVPVAENIVFNKKQILVQDLPEAGEYFDLVYFDAFAPSKQPEIWKVEVFQKLFRMMKKGGILVTYCAQGQFKRNLKTAGFEVETIQGPPGKKEMVRGWKV